MATINFGHKGAPYYLYRLEDIKPTVDGRPSVSLWNGPDDPIELHAGDIDGLIDDLRGAKQHLLALEHGHSE